MVRRITCYERPVSKKVLRIAVLVALAGAVGAIVYVLRPRPFASDHTPEGAYARIAFSLGEGHARDIFAYLETDAQWACYTIKDSRKAALARVAKSYPPAARPELEAAYRAEAEAPDGADVFVLEADKRGWIARLRRDLSGIASVESDGERASVVTARGTRYPFHVRNNGIWGLTIFTADLAAEAERAARDLAMVNAAGDDYDRAAQRGP
jgi:hypothetical protein